MITLSLSSGYAWSIWNDEGGVQPSIESLDLPPKECAALKDWSKTSKPNLHAPEFTGRKEHDAQGRELAQRLQTALGDRLHVAFTSWLAFDPNKWRSQWLKEDLVAGSAEDYWIDDDLPEEIVCSIVKIYPDCGGAYLWDLDGCMIGNDNPKYSDMLDKQFTEWSESWDAAFDMHTVKVDKERLAAERFDERGLALAVALKKEIGDAASVIYCCNLRDAAVEILDTFHLKEWPRDTDFRKRALDAAVH